MYIFDFDSFNYFLYLSRIADELRRDVLLSYLDMDVFQAVTMSILEHLYTFTVVKISSFVVILHLMTTFIA